MKKRGTPLGLIGVVLIIVGCLFLSLLARVTKGTLRELPQRQIRPMVKRFTGRELPGKAEDLRAIFHSYRGLELIFVVFQTNQEGCSYILDAFVGKHVKMHEFPHAENNTFEWHGMADFSTGCRYQKQLGVVLFDEDLIGRIRRDDLEYVNTGRYPTDAVTGYYLAGASFDPSSKIWCHYAVVVFKDQGLVYICAEQVPKGVYFR